MPKLPAIKAKDLIKILIRQGYSIGRIHGSHYILRNREGFRTTIPYHGRGEIPKGTLLGILHDLKMTKEELVKLLK
jgi:predicted RNA binding protein YcfA (HicA-like mRNA interferase family)